MSQSKGIDKSFDTRDSSENKRLPAYNVFDPQDKECKCLWMPLLGEEDRYPEIGFQGNRCDKFQRKRGCKFGDNCRYCHVHPKNSNEMSENTRPGHLPKRVRIDAESGERRAEIQRTAEKIRS